MHFRFIPIVSKTKAEIAMTNNQTRNIKLTILGICALAMVLAFVVFNPSHINAQGAPSPLSPQETMTTTTSTTVGPPVVPPSISGITAAQVDYLAGKSDRWLFLGALVLLLSFGATTIYWCLAQLDKQRAANNELQKQFIDYLKDNSSDHAANLRLNTEALKANNEISQKVADALKIMDYQSRE